jgi:hypothetical protein
MTSIMERIQSNRIHTLCIQRDDMLAELGGFECLVNALAQNSSVTRLVFAEMDVHAESIAEIVRKSNCLRKLELFDVVFNGFKVICRGDQTE